jgi:hypothetical protein
VESSVADPGCLSPIPDPDFYPSRIPDHGSRIHQQQKRRGKFFVLPFFVANKFTKLLFFKTKNIWVGKPGARENLHRFRILDPGSGSETLVEREYSIQTGLTFLAADFFGLYHPFAVIIDTVRKKKEKERN